VLGIGRYHEKEKLIALFNFSDDAQTAWVDEHEDYIDLITKEKRPAKAVGIPAYSFAWLMTNN
jgi:amylosucrase